MSTRPEEAPGTSSSTQAATERELQAHAVDGPTGKAVESLAGEWVTGLKSTRSHDVKSIDVVQDS